VELVARGLSNRQIAKQLFIAERTVEGHVQQLLNLLGVSSRTQVAAWYVRRQLAAAAADDAAETQTGARVTLLMAELSGWPVPRDGPEPWPLRRFAELFSIRAHRFGGMVSGLAGSPGRRVGIFPEPGPAAACAFDLHRAVAAAYWAPGARSTARIALHLAGAPPAEGGRPDPALAETERLVDLGGEGRTLVSAAVEAALGSSPGLGAELRLAGLEPAPVYELLDPESAPSPGPPAGRDRPTNLPPHMTSFVNREVELAELREQLDHSRLVTLIGPGGVGKTRLALELAAGLLDAFADGVWLVELAQLADPRLVVQAVASAVHVHEKTGPRLIDTVSQHLSGRRVLLVLDNCEHMVSACAELAVALLRGCPSLVVVATSRELLAVPGERIYRVPPLAHPASDVALEVTTLGRYPAMRLFVDRASARQPRFRLTPDNTAVVAQVSRRLEGIPLAIELAAAWTHVIEVDELLGRLEDRYEMLARGPRTSPARHQTLSAAIDWSDQLLSEPERRLFHRLSVFVAGFRLPDLEAVCGERTSSATLELLSRLVDQSLVLSEGGRYRCLETIRDYGRRQLRAEGDMDALQARHARHFADVVSAREPGQTALWLRRLREVHAEIRAALQWSLDADPGLALRLVEDLHTFWLYSGHLAESRQWADSVVGAVGGEPWPRARALAASALAAYSQADFEVGAERAEEAASLASDAGDDLTLANARRVQGLLALAAEAPGVAEAFCAESLEIYRRLSERAGEMNVLYTLGLVAGYQGEFDRAREMFEASLEIGTELGCRDEGSATLAFLGVVALGTGKLADARASIEESALAARQLGDRRAAWTLDVAARLAATEGYHERALTLAGAAREMFLAAGVTPPGVWTQAIMTWLDKAREALGPEGAAAAWAAGAALTFDQALDLALTPALSATEPA